MISLKSLSIFMLVMSCFNSLKANTPMKMMVCMVGVALSSLILMSTMSSESWMPFVYFLIFIGGIVILFSIMTAVLPNQSDKKMGGMKGTPKKIMMSLILSFIALESINVNMPMLKINYYSQGNELFMILLIMAYFTMFLTMISVNSGSLRSYCCSKKSIL